jgi:hypothetical protein
MSVILSALFAFFHPLILFIHYLSILRCLSVCLFNLFYSGTIQFKNTWVCTSCVTRVALHLRINNKSLLQANIRMQLLRLKFDLKLKGT